MYVTWKIERYAYTNNTWSSTANVLTGYFGPTLTVNAGDARDTFSLQLTDTDGSFANYFSPNDRIVISRVVNSSFFASSDVLMTGTVQNSPYQEDSRRSVVRVEGTNFSEAILGGIVFFDPRGLTIPNAIQAALNSITNYNSNFGVTWKGTNPVVKSDGSAFPTVNEKWFNKPIKSFVEKYSTNETTQDGSYFYYVNNANEFVWGKKNNAPVHTYNESTGTHKFFRVNKDIKDVKNWVVVKGGVDVFGAAIQTRVQDMQSIAKHGLKPYILVTIAKNAETLIKEDLNAQGVDRADNLSFPYTPPWNGSSVGSLTAYNEALRVYVIEEAKKEARSYIESRKNGKLKIDLGFKPGDVAWGVGDVVACTLSVFGASPKNLRVEEIVYATDMDTFTMIEDEGTL